MKSKLWFKMVKSPLMVTGLLLSFSGFAFSCNCPFRATCSAYSDASAIFTAKLVRIERNLESKAPVFDVYFDVKELYKGKTEDIVRMSFRGGDCSPEFIVGESYIVFQETAAIQSLCNLTDLLSRSKRLLEYVKSFSEQKPIFAVSGIITGLSDEQLSDAKLTIEEPNGISKVAVDGFGRFNFVFKREGRYIARLNFPFEADIEVLSDGVVLTDLVNIKHGPNLTSLEYEVKFKANSCDFREIGVSEKHD